MSRVALEGNHSTVTTAVSMVILTSTTITSGVQGYLSVIDTLGQANLSIVESLSTCWRQEMY